MPTRTRRSAWRPSWHSPISRASDEAAKAVAEALRSGLARNDRWLADAATAAAARNDLAFLKAMAAAPAADQAWPARMSLRIVERVAEHWARGGPVERVGGLLASLKGGNAALDEALLRGMARGWPKGTAREARSRDRRGGQAARHGAARRRPRSAHPAGQPWGDPVLDGINAEMATTLLKSAQDESLSESRRVDAAKQLIELRSASDETAQQLLALITPRTSPDLAAGLIDAVAAGSAPGAASAMVERLAGARALAEGRR